MGWRGRTWKRGGSKLKRDANDGHFSNIVRFGKHRCAMCGCVRDLECAHIMGRRHYATRFMFYPVKNGVALCNTCHSWFDEHKITALLWEPNKRVLSWDEESYTFLVQKCGYTWEELQLLYVKSQEQATGYEYKKKEISVRLRAELKRLEKSEVNSMGVL